MRLVPIDAPTLSPPVVNLLAAANTPDNAAVRWQEGSAYESRACTQVNLRDTCDPTQSAVVKAGVGADDPEGRRVESVAVYAETLYECMSLPASLDEFRDIVRDAMVAELPRAVEHELWTGAIARAADLPNRYLTDADRVQVLNGGTAVTPTAAIGLLEDALGDVYSGVGIIHAQRRAAAFLTNVTRNGRIIETRVGNRVVPGVGYPGTGPDTPPDPPLTPGPAETWLYITPMVTVRVGQVELPDQPTVDRDVNRAQIRARQPFEVSWDGCASAFAVLMQTVVE